MRNFLYILTFSLVTPITLVTTLFALQTTFDASASAHAETSRVTVFKNTGLSLPYASNTTPPSEKVLGIATASDARVEIIRQYLAKYKSPLLGHEEKLVDAAEKYDLDFRFLVAIAQQESNLCKIIPNNSYNCWGWGIHSEGTLKFSSYDEAIELVARGLKEEYFNKGYTTPELIMKKYTPLSPGTWALGVRQFMQEME